MICPILPTARFFEGEYAENNSLDSVIVVGSAGRLNHYAKHAMAKNMLAF